MGTTTRFLTLFLFSAMLSFAQDSFATSIFVNEIHYDNAGGDVGEFVEIAVPAGFTALADIDFSLYNGNGGLEYDTSVGTDFTAGDTGVTIGGSMYDLYTLSYAVNGIQNGPDGWAISNNGALCEFLSYEGDFTAMDGIANGMTSTDIGVSESSGTPIGGSLQLVDGTWLATDSNTLGQANVPEPATFGLAIFGLIGLACIRLK